VFQKTGFTAQQMGNLHHGRTVTHTKRSIRSGKLWHAYTKLNLWAPKDKYGNSRVDTVPAFRQYCDCAKLLSKVLPNNYSQQDFENIDRRLNNGDIVPIPKRGAKGTLEVFDLYVAPNEEALMTIDKNGEAKKITAPTTEMIRNDQSQMLQSQQSRSETAGNEQSHDKGAEAAQKMAESQENNKRQPPASPSRLITSPSTLNLDLDPLSLPCPAAFSGCRFF
jgi:hypothetical protein